MNTFHAYCISPIYILQPITHVRDHPKTTSRLVHIGKVWVLLIGQILEGGRIQIILRYWSPLCSELLLPLILPLESVSQKDEDEQLETIANQDRTDTELVAWCLALLIEEWPEGSICVRPCSVGTKGDTTHPAMLPTQAPTQIIPDTIIFFDCPPTLEVMSDRESTAQSAR